MTCINSNSILVYLENMSLSNHQYVLNEQCSIPIIDTRTNIVILSAWRHHCARSQSHQNFKTPIFIAARSCLISNTLHFLPILYIFYKKPKDYDSSSSHVTTFKIIFSHIQVDIQRNLVIPGGARRRINPN